MISAQSICPLLTRILAPGSVPADLKEYPGKPRYMASAINLRNRFWLHEEELLGLVHTADFGLNNSVTLWQLSTSIVNTLQR